MKIKHFLHHLNRRDTRLFPHLKPLAKFILILTIIIGSVFLTKNILALSDVEGSGDMTINLETTGIVEEYLNKQKAIDDGNNQEAWINESLISNTVSMNKAIVGDLDEKSFTLGWVPGGLIGLTNNSIAALYTPPASGVEYIAQTINQFTGKPAYAQNGYGYQRLSGIMSLWKTMRNAVYTLISLFFIILGIMIMLRIKTSPQTTITIQIALPKIITTLVLVTFSYAIAGLLIDFSYVFEGIILTILKNSENFNGALNNNVQTVPGLMNINFQGVSDIVFKNLVTWGVISAISGLIGLSAILTAPLTWGASVVMGVLAFGIVFLLICVYLLFQVVKLFFGLAKCYITVILKIIIAPLEIALGVFPSSKTGFSSWIFDLIANLAVFPATVIFLVIATIIKQAISNTEFFSPTMMGNGPILGGIVGIASITLLSKIPQIVPEVIFKLKPSPIGKYTDGAFTNNNIAKGLQKRTQDRIAEKSDAITGRMKAGIDQKIGQNQKLAPIMGGIQKIRDFVNPPIGKHQKRH